jgi:hypothetical protein
VIPSIEIEIGPICVMFAILNERVALKLLLKEIKVVEYYRREQIRAFSRQVNQVSANNIMTTIYDDYDHFERTNA